MSTTLLDTKKLLASAKLSRSLKWDDLIKEAAKEHGLKKDDLENLIEELEEKIEDSIPLEDFENYYIKRIYLENFMVHKDTELILDKHLNVVGGHTGSGKTAILRALECILENKITGFSNPRQAVTLGEDQGSITVELSNGYVIKRILHRDKTAENYYMVTDPGMEVFKYKVSEVKEVQKVFGFQYLKIENKNINLNYLQQGNGWFFIGSEFPSSQRAKILGALFGTQDLDVVLKKYIEKVQGLKKNVNKKTTEKEVLDEKLISIKEADSKTKNISDAEGKIQELEKTEKELNELLSLQERFISANEKVKKYQEEFDKIKGQDFSELSESLSEIEKLDNEINKLKKLKIKHDEITKKGKLYNKKIKLNRKILEKMNNTLSSFEEVEKLQKMKSKYDKLSKTGQAYVLDLKSKKEELEQVKSDYKDELLKIGVCPCCNQKITEDVAQHMIENH